MTLEAHVTKWWDVANARRQRLILKKCKGDGLTARQLAEFKMLQHVAQLVMSYAAPIDFSRLEELERQVAQLTNGIAKKEGRKV